jgi:hypothetical protein
MPVVCDYLAVQWDNTIWVRHEMCQFAKRNNDGIDGVFVGARVLEFRPIQSMDQGKCADADKKLYPRYKIGDKEWICVIK